MIGTELSMKIRPTYFCRLIVVLVGLAINSAARCSNPLTHIAAGSCNRQDLPQPLWDSILKFQPQLWVGLGDNIYGDTDDLALLEEKWTKQKKILIRASSLTPVWSKESGTTTTTAGTMPGLNTSGKTNPSA
jgi:hypothetical protein